jgi:hypothetical protein
MGHQEIYLSGSNYDPEIATKRFLAQQRARQERADRLQRDLEAIRRRELSDSAQHNPASATNSSVANELGNQETKE